MAFVCRIRTACFCSSGNFGDGQGEWKDAQNSPGAGEGVRFGIGLELELVFGLRWVGMGEGIRMQDEGRKRSWDEGSRRGWDKVGWGCSRIRVQS